MAEQDARKGAQTHRPLVLKIGGSLLATGQARHVLQRVAQSERRVVIVPGGGAFADAVRAAQAEQGFGDAVAHRLAILAMHQMAAEFQDMQPRLLPAESVSEIQSAWEASAIPVWLPWSMVQDDPSIAQDWSFTSDSLAAWLAAKLVDAEVLLVKSCRVPTGLALDRLAVAGIIDAQFPGVIAKSGLGWHVLGEGGEARLASLLAIG